MNALRRVARSVVAALSMALWIGVPASAATLMALHGRQQAEPPGTVPTWVPVEPSDPYVLREAQLALRWQVQEPLLAPTWEGLVQRALVHVGDRVAIGTPIAQVAGVNRIYVDSDVPFTRPLARGDAGTDVAQLNSVLGRLGLSAGSGATFGMATERGVRDLARSLSGFEFASFDPNWFVFATGTSGIVSSIELPVGAPAPAPGSPIVELAPTLDRADAIAPRDDVADETHGGSDPSASSTSAPLESTTDTAPIDRLTLPRGAQALLAGTPIGALNTDGSVLAEALPGLAAIADPSAQTLDVVVRSPAPPDARGVPAASVFTGSDGTTCVVARSGSGRSLVTPVSVADTPEGRATVTGVPHETDAVLVDPPRRDRRRCRSN